MSLRTVFSAMAAMSLTGAVSAQSISGGTIGGGPTPKQEKLQVGSDAPKLSIQEWIKGEKLEELQDGQVYVVEFWATWCGPCLRSIPHLTKLQKEFGDSVIIIGVSNEEPSTIKPFVESQGTKMEYRVAADRGNQTSNDWMKAAGQNGIPCAFVVDANKKIAWIGNPIYPEGEIDRVLAKVADGRYDPKLQKEAEPFLQQIDYALRVQDWRVCMGYLNQVIDMNPYVFNKVAIRKFRIMLLDQGVTDEAIDYARNEFADKYMDDHETLALLTTEILSDSEVLAKDPERMRELALELGEKAYEASGKSDAGSASAYAMALYHNGKYDEAVNMQQRAYLMAEPREKAAHKRLLDQYRAGLQMHR